jgi:hypothetical protein
MFLQYKSNYPAERHKMEKEGEGDNRRRRGSKSPKITLNLNFQAQTWVITKYLEIRHPKRLELK